MTDLIETGSADRAGNPEAIVDGAGPQGSDPGAAGFLDGLSEDNRRVAEAKGWEDFDGIVASYRNLEAKIGDSLRMPEEGAAQEEWDAFYDRLGRPDAPDAYVFDMPRGLDENFAYDGEAAVRFAGWAHEAGLNTRQAQMLHDRFVQDLNAHVQAQGESHDTAAGDAHDAIMEAWGEPATERYKRNVELANRAIRELGGQDLAAALRGRGLIGEDGLVTEPAIAFMLQKAGERLFSEDQVFSANAHTSNPFARDGENITEQGRLLRNDPDLARTYIRAANREAEFPRLFGAEF